MARRRLVLHRRIDLLDVTQVHVLGVLAAPADLRPLGGVVEVGQAGVVELQVGAAQLAEPAHLVGVGSGQIGPESLDVGIDRGVEHRGAAAVVNHVRRGDGLLGDGRGHVVPDEREVFAEDGVVQPDLAADVQRGGRPIDGPGRVGELHREMAGRPGDPAELVNKVHVPGRPPELPVGGRLQAHLFLHSDRLDDLFILDRAQVSSRDPARREILTRLVQPGRPEQAADVVGPERRGGPAGHLRPLPRLYPERAVVLTPGQPGAAARVDLEPPLPAVQVRSRAQDRGCSPGQQCPAGGWDAKGVSHSAKSRFG